MLKGGVGPHIPDETLRHRSGKVIVVRSIQATAVHRQSDRLEQQQGCAGSHVQHLGDLIVCGNSGGQCKLPRDWLAAESLRQSQNRLCWIDLAAVAGVQGERVDRNPGRDRVGVPPLCDLDGWRAVRDIEDLGVGASEFNILAAFEMQRWTGTRSPDDLAEVALLVESTGELQSVAIDNGRRALAR